MLTRTRIELEPLVPHASRITALQIGILDLHQFETRPEFPACYFLGCCLSYSSDSKQFNEFLSHFPNLERLHIPQASRTNVFPAVPLLLLTRVGLHQITFSPHQYTQMLNCLPKLATLDLKPVGMDFTEHLSPQPQRSLHQLRLLGGRFDLFSSILEAVQAEPEVLQIELPLEDISDSAYWIHNVIGAYPARILYLSFGNGYLSIQSHQYNDGLSSDSPGSPVSNHHLLSRDPSFDIVELNIGPISARMSQVQQIEISRLLGILSSFKVQAIRWNMPDQPLDPDHLICVGFGGLETLYKYIHEGFQSWGVGGGQGHSKPAEST